MDISSRHVPDLSDISAAQDLSDTSFQIPMTSKSPSKLLFAEDGLDLLSTVEDTLNSPAQQPLATCSSEPLNAAAPTPKPTRTPRSRRRVRVEMDPSTPLRRSPRKKATIPSPLKEVVASDMTAASENTFSPFKRQQDFSFQIPTIGNQAMDLLMDDAGVSFLCKGINATFAEEPPTPRAHEPLNLSQLSPGPKSSRAPDSPFSRRTTPLSSQDVQHDENTAPSHLGHQQHDASLVSVSGQPSLHSDLKAEIQILMNDQEELTQGILRPSSAPLVEYTSVVGQPTDCMEDDTKHVSDTAEKELTPPHVPPADLATSELDGAAAGTVTESMYNQDAKSTQNEAVIGSGLSKLAKAGPLSTGHARTRSTRSSALRKPKSKSQSSVQTKPQLDHDRGEMLQSAVHATGSKSRVAVATTLEDTTISDTEGLAAVLFTFEQRTTALSISPSAKATHSKSTPKLNRIESHASATVSGSALETDLVREVGEPECDLEVPIETIAVSVTTPDANAYRHDQPNQRDIFGIPGDHDCSMSAPSHIPVVSPNEEHVPLSQGDVDVDMGDEHNNSLTLAAPAEIQTATSQELLDLTGHDVSMVMPHDEINNMGTMPLPSRVVGPTSPMRTAVKRSASAFEESDKHDRYQPPPESEQAPRRKKTKVSSSPAPAPALSRRTRVLRARTATGLTSKTTKAAAAVAVRSKRVSRALASRAKPAAATHPTGVSALESGVRSSSSRSAAAAHIANGSESSAKPPSKPNRLGNVNAPHSIVAVGGLTPTASVHMTRARTRDLSGSNSSTSSDSAMGASLGGSTAVNSSRKDTSLARSSSSITEEGPFLCDVRDSVKTDLGRQEPLHEDGIRTTTTTTVPKRGHMHRSGTNQSSVSIPPAKPTVPVEFHFESEARLEARRTGVAERAADEATLKRLEHYRAMHETQARELAARKEHIHPVQPKDFHFSTDIRAQEREKWEETRRAREREAERLLEEKRRLEALKEEEEIRELRRRAVPKANEMPEWYRYAPKRSQDTK